MLTIIKFACCLLLTIWKVNNSYISSVFLFNNCEFLYGVVLACTITKRKLHISEKELEELANVSHCLEYVPEEEKIWQVMEALELDGLGVMRALTVHRFKPGLNQWNCLNMKFSGEVLGCESWICRSSSSLINFMPQKISPWAKFILVYSHSSSNTLVPTKMDPEAITYNSASGR